MDKTTEKPISHTNPDYVEDLADEAVRLAREEVQKEEGSASAEEPSQKEKPPEELPLKPEQLPEGAVEFDKPEEFFADGEKKPPVEESDTGKKEDEFCDDDDPRLGVLKEFGVDVTKESMEFAGKFLEGDKSYKELQGEFTRRSQKLADIERKGESVEELPSSIDVSELIGLPKEDGSAFTIDDFQREALDEFGNIKDKTAFAVGLQKLIDSSSNRNRRADIEQVTNALETKYQYEKVISTHPELAKKHLATFLKGMKLNKPTLLDGFEFFLHRNRLLPENENPDIPQPKPRKPGNSRGRIDKNVHRKATLAGISNTPVRKITDDPTREYENFFGESF